MKQYCILAFLTTLPALVNAEDTVEASPYYIKGGVNASILDDVKKDSEAFGYEAMVGFHYNNDIFIEAGYQNFDLSRDDDLDLDAITARANWLIPVSDYASLYAGAGFSYIKEELSPTAQLGLQYQLSSSWYADVSYQGIFDLEEVNDDLYSFNLSFLYRFPSNQPVVVEKPVPEPPKEIIEASKQRVEVCEIQSFPYVLEKGDYLIKIANQNKVQLEDILRLNPQLRGRNINLVYPGESINYPDRVCEYQYQ